MIFALYLLKRLAMGVLVLVIVGTFLVMVVHVVPGDPARAIAQAQGNGFVPTNDYIKYVRHALWLDTPITTQWWLFFSHAVRGDFGNDLSTQAPVSTEISSVLPDTILLALAGVMLAIAVGLPLGIAAARRPGSSLDRLIGGVSMLFLSGLPYVIALALLLVFAVRLPWLPALGAGSPSKPIDFLRHLILPAIAIAVPWWGYLARLVRASVLEVMGSQYIRTHRAFGVRERIIFYRYALRNALVPVVAYFGLMLGSALAGTVFVEAVFVRPGLGGLAIIAVTERNWPIIRATGLLFAAFYVGANLLADIGARLLDPRIRLDQSAEA